MWQLGGEIRRPGGPEFGRAGRIDRLVKRLLDAAVAAFLLVLLAPICAVVALAVLASGGRPVLYRARRVGHQGRPLDVLKFRKMRTDAVGLPLTVCEDDRFTTIGRFLAASKLDEVPQLLNVLVGQMSIVGPRPEDLRFVEMFSDEFRSEILTVRPGVTGLSQLAFAKESRILDPADRMRDYTGRILPQKIAIDRMYVANRTVWMDIQIMFWTLAATVRRHDIAVNRQSGCLGVRRRPSPVREEYRPRGAEVAG